MRMTCQPGDSPEVEVFLLTEDKSGGGVTAVPAPPNYRLEPTIQSLCVNN